MKLTAIIPTHNRIQFLSRLIEQLEIEIKYEGYIKRQEELVVKTDKLEGMTIPLNFNYNNLKTISTEGREKLAKIKPHSIGQASRISGITPSDISINPLGPTILQGAVLKISPDSRIGAAIPILLASVNDNST